MNNDKTGYLKRFQSDNIEEIRDWIYDKIYGPDLEESEGDELFSEEQHNKYRKKRERLDIMNKCLRNMEIDVDVVYNMVRMKNG